MTLESGSRFGPYEVVEQIGSGGMGEVWRATDTVLGRDVAVKVLPQAFVDDADRLARFRREAELLASLNHPNIATIHGLEKVDGQTVIVMELVEGPTLADRIKEGPIPPEEAVGIALQVDAALEAPHDKQIVHRDLKPANVKVRDDGTVKVLDFGISKPIDPTAISGSPVMTTPAVTQTGVILGTAAYMSPEQARGQFVDERTDVWAFGCLLFEMLTGQPAFAGEDVMAILARVIDRDSDLNSMPGTVSPAVRRTIKLCLEKDAKKRIADIRDVRLALKGAFETIATHSDVPAGHGGWRRAFVIAAVIVLAVGVGFGGWWLKPEPPQPLTRSYISAPDAPFAPTLFDNGLAVSPDGERIAYRGTVEGEPRLLLRSRDTLEVTELVAQAQDIRSPFFSPDGNWIGFSDGSGFYRVSANGGQPIPIIENLGGYPFGATWAPDDTIIFATSAPGLKRIPVSGGVEPEMLTVPDSTKAQSHRWPKMLPGGQALLFAIVSDTEENPQVALLRLGQQSEPEVLVEVGTSPHYTESGHIVYAVGNTLRAVGFDLRNLKVTTNEFPIVDDVNTTPGAASFDVSDDGSLVYASGGAGGGLAELVFIYRDGRPEEVLPFAPETFSWPRLSRNMQRVAVFHADLEIWVYDVRTGGRNRVTNSPGVDNVPAWVPDDESVIFATMREGTGIFSFYQQRADGTGEAEKFLGAKETGNFKPYDWTPDGTQMLFDYGQPSALNIGLATAGEIDDWEPLFESDTVEAAPALSRDGNWIAYASNRSGRCEIYIERFPTLGTRIPISTDGGAEPLWSPTRDEIYYRQGDRLVAVGIDFENGVELGRPELIARDLPQPGCGGRTYDVSSDGEKFLFAKSAGSGGRAIELVLVQGWFAELTRLVPTY